jgi:hypothetical protein
MIKAIMEIAKTMPSEKKPTKAVRWNHETCLINLPKGRKRRKKKKRNKQQQIGQTKSKQQGDSFQTKYINTIKQGSKYPN